MTVSDSHTTAIQRFAILGMAKLHGTTADEIPSNDATQERGAPALAAATDERGLVRKAN